MHEAPGTPTVHRARRFPLAGHGTRAWRRWGVVVAVEALAEVVVFGSGKGLLARVADGLGEMRLGGLPWLRGLPPEILGVMALAGGVWGRERRDEGSALMRSLWHALQGRLGGVRRLEARLLGLHKAGGWAQLLSGRRVGDPQVKPRLCRICIRVGLLVDQTNPQVGEVPRGRLRGARPLRSRGGHAARERRGHRAAFACAVRGRADWVADDLGEAVGLLRRWGRPCGNRPRRRRHGRQLHVHSGYGRRRDLRGTDGCLCDGGEGCGGTSVAARTDGHLSGSYQL